MMVLIAICLSVLLTATLVGCSSSDNSDGYSNDGGDMMDDGNSNDGGDMMDNDGSGGDRDNGTMNP
jgi:major membrane immunogen (membrane-anchored lipoprotein)